MNGVNQANPLLRKPPSSTTQTQQNKKWQPIAKIALGVLGGLAVVYASYHAYQFMKGSQFEACLLDEDKVERCVKACEFDDLSCNETIERSFYKLVDTNPQKAATLASSCLESTNWGCEHVTQKAFSELLNVNEEAALRFAQGCAGNHEEKCQKTIDKAFELFLKNDEDQKDVSTGASFSFPKIWRLAQACLGKSDLACKSVNENVFSASILNNPKETSHLIEHCIGKEELPCRMIIEKAHALYLNHDLSNAIRLAERCFNKGNPTCEKIIKENYPKLLEETGSFALSLFIGNPSGEYLKALMQTDDPVAQQVIREAFPSLYQKGPNFAEFFVKDCIEAPSNSACQDVVRTAIPFFLKNDEYAAKALLATCKTIQSPACQEVIELAKQSS